MAPNPTSGEVLDANDRKLGTYFRKSDGEWHAMRDGMSLSGQCNFASEAAAIAAIRGAFRADGRWHAPRADAAATGPAPRVPPTVSVAPAARPAEAPIDIRALAAQGAQNEWRREIGLQSQFATPEEYSAFILAAADGNVAAVSDGWERQWRGKPALQREFVTAESYAAFRRYSARRRR